MFDGAIEGMAVGSGGELVRRGKGGIDESRVEAVDRICGRRRRCCKA